MMHKFLKYFTFILFFALFAQVVIPSFSFASLPIATGPDSPRYTVRGDLSPSGLGPNMEREGWVLNN